MFCTGLIRLVQKDTWDFFLLLFGLFGPANWLGEDARPCRGHHFAIFCSKRLASAWQAPRKHVASAWQARGKRLANTWQALGKRLANTWQAYGKPPLFRGKPPLATPILLQFSVASAGFKCCFYNIKKAAMRRVGLAHPEADRLLEFYQKGVEKLGSPSSRIFHWHATPQTPCIPHWARGASRRAHSSVCHLLRRSFLSQKNTSKAKGSDPGELRVNHSSL